MLKSITMKRILYSRQNKFAPMTFFGKVVAKSFGKGWLNHIVKLANISHFDSSFGKCSFVPWKTDDVRDALLLRKTVALKDQESDIPRSLLTKKEV